MRQSILGSHVLGEEATPTFGGSRCELGVKVVGIISTAASGLERRAHLTTEEFLVNKNKQ